MIKISFFQRALYYLQDKIDKININANDLASSLYTFSREKFERIFVMHSLDCVVPIEAFFMNDRYHIQQSIYLAQCNPEKKFPRGSCKAKATPNRLCLKQPPSA